MKKMICVMVTITLLFIGTPGVMAAEGAAAGADATEASTAADAGAVGADTAAGKGLSTTAMVTLGVVGAAVAGAVVAAGSSGGGGSDHTNDSGHSSHSGN